MPTKASKKSTAKPTYINKVQEVYHYIRTHPDKSDREIVEGLRHVGAPAVHMSLKSLVEGGYVSRTEIDEVNKLGRKMGRYKVVPSKPYEPKFGRGAKTAEAGKSAKVRPSGGADIGKPTASAKPRRSFRVQRMVTPSTSGLETHLTVPTDKGPVDLTIPQARGVYNELRKLFEA